MPRSIVSYCSAVAEPDAASSCRNQPVDEKCLGIEESRGFPYYRFFYISLFPWALKIAEVETVMRFNSCVNRQTQHLSAVRVA